MGRTNDAGGNAPDTALVGKFAGRTAPSTPSHSIGGAEDKMQTRPSTSFVAGAGSNMYTDVDYPAMAELPTEFMEAGAEPTEELSTGDQLAAAHETHYWVPTDVIAKKNR